MPETDIYKVSEYLLKSWEDYPIFIDKDDDGEIVGVLGTRVEKVWWSDEPILSDYILFSEKDVKPLIEAARDFAKLEKLKFLSFVTDKRISTKRAFRENEFKTRGFIAIYNGNIR